MSANASPRSASRFDSGAPSSSRVDSRTVAKRQCSASWSPSGVEHAEVRLGVADVDDEQHRRNYTSGGPHAAHRLAGAEGRELVGQPLARRQRQLGVELEQRHEHEAPRADLGMRQRQPRRAVRERRRAAAGRRRSPADRGGRRRPRGRPRARPALQASSSGSGSSSVSIRRQALKNSRWSSTRPTGSVSYTDEDASTATPCSRQRRHGRLAGGRAGRRCSSRARGSRSPGCTGATAGHRASRHTSTDTSLTGSASGGSGLAALTQTALAS